MEEVEDASAQDLGHSARHAGLDAQAGLGGNPWQEKKIKPGAGQPAVYKAGGNDQEIPGVLEASLRVVRHGQESGPRATRGRHNGCAAP